MKLEFPGWSEMSAWAITLAKQSMRMANGRIGTKYRLQSSLPHRRKSGEEVVDRSVVRILPKSVLVGIQLSVRGGNRWGLSRPPDIIWSRNEPHTEFVKIRMESLLPA
jgi:hypothetical protein